jgi:hypothetical protein
MWLTNDRYATSAVFSRGNEVHVRVQLGLWQIQ